MNLKFTTVIRIDAFQNRYLVRPELGFLYFSVMQVHNLCYLLGLSLELQRSVFFDESWLDSLL